jgi:glyoxylase-like metal-dependent hydrolase (beta-lactamase superfamily II)
MRQLLTDFSRYLAVLILSGICYAGAPVKLSPHISVSQNAVNGVFIENAGRVLVVYGDPERHLPKADMVLFTHSRRDVVWAGRDLVENGAKSVVPADEAQNFLRARDFWKSFAQARFHDYRQQTTKIPTEDSRVDRVVKGGDSINWQDMAIKVVDTPGYTRGSVSYFLTIDGIKFGFVGDIIFGDGHLLDLYSLQDAVSEAQIGGYHGYAGRLGQLINSLRKIINENPDIVVPARGPVIRDPRASVGRLIQRLQAAYKNYLSINAGHWYFKDRYETLAARVLEPNDRVDWMPYAITIRPTPPNWIIPIHNSRLLLSQDASGFLIDCGSDAIIGEVVKLREKGRLSRLDGLFITHYHDDHTDRIVELVRRFGCPVYATQELKDILEHPKAYRLPAMTSSGVTNLTAVPDGRKMTWKEFDLTFYDFPGQSIYHDALLAEKRGGETVFFIGDSFTPSGIDDYCLQNRNFLHHGMGYFYCLDILQKTPRNCLLINQHVLEPFGFSEEQLRHMTEVLEKRKEILASLFPWDEPNYGIDEQWARIYPYGQEAKAGQRVEILVKILNHSGTPHTYTVTPHVPEGFELLPAKASIEIKARKEEGVRFEITVPKVVSEKIHVITADIQFDEWNLQRWCEAMIEVYP